MTKMTKRAKKNYKAHSWLKSRSSNAGSPNCSSEQAAQMGDAVQVNAAAAQADVASCTWATSLADGNVAALSRVMMSWQGAS